MAECSRNAPEKIYPADPVLREPVAQLLVPEPDRLLDSRKYGLILEILENMGAGYA